jgi:hypothetical protein
MKNGKYISNGDYRNGRGSAEPLQLPPPRLDVPAKGAEITKNRFRSAVAPRRAKLLASLAKAIFRLQVMRTEAPKLRLAIDEGRSHPLTDDTSPKLPSTFVGWLGLVVFALTLVGIEISTALNSMTYAIPLAQSRIRAIAMSVPLLAVPVVVKCLLPPFRRSRIALGSLALGAILAFAVVFAYVLGTPLGDGGVLLLSLQLVCEGLAMASVSAIMATIIRRTATERQRQEYTVLLKEQAELEGQIAALDTLLEGIDADETAITDEATTLFQAEQAKLDIISAQIARFQGLRRNSHSNLDH